MAEDDSGSEAVRGLGAIALGFVSLGVVPLAGGWLPDWAWLPIALGLIAAMRFLPAPAAWPLKIVCYAVGFLAALLLLVAAMILPGGLIYAFSRTIVEIFPRWLQMVTLIVWLLALAGISALLYSRPLRRAARAGLRSRAPSRLQALWPERVSAGGAIALYVNFVFVAAGCFAAFAFMLHDPADPLFLPAGRDRVDHGALGDFLLGHLLDSIPGLKVPETIQWKAPLTYTHAGAGWLLLLFKLMVIVPVVSGVGRYLRDDAGPSTPPGPES